MKIFYQPVNLNQYDIFQQVKQCGHVEAFLATNEMKPGDLMLFHVGTQNTNKVKPGIYAYGEIISHPYIYTDENEHIVSLNVTILTAVNKLQELFQKKVIKIKPEYNAEYDFITGDWVVTCKLGDGSVFEHSETSKVVAKKFAAMKAYDYILKNQDILEKL